jgi:glycosyltransferase involved in cell wall biosynthesis
VRILFIEPFYGGSHRAFADGLQWHSRHDIHILSLPDGEWRARMRRGAQELAARAASLAGSFDAIVATDMLDLAAFLALTRPRFAKTPVLYYLHENQFTYPRIRGTKLNSWFGQINYLSALAADRVAFNSEYHRQDFLGALRTLAGQPNNWLVEDAIGAIEAKSSVLPIGVELTWLDDPLATRTPRGAAPPMVLWNHRWEFDKAPDVFARTLLRLAAEGLQFEVALAGDPGPNPHPVMSELRDALGGRVVQFGHVQGREAYRALLAQSDVVVSTTRHEFFGVGIVEALYAGCHPVLPDAFTYPGLVPTEFHDRCLFSDEDSLTAKLRAAILGPRVPAEPLRASAARFAWPAVAALWDAAIEALTR